MSRKNAKRLWPRTARLRTIVAIVTLLLCGLLLAGCGPTEQPATDLPGETLTPEPDTVSEATSTPVPTLASETEPTPQDTSTPEPTAPPRTGAWLDTLVMVTEPSPDVALARLEAGDLDAYFGLVSNRATYETVKSSPDLVYTEAVGTYGEILFNPVGPTFAETGALNPFHVPKIREAMNWLVDRDYVVGELLAGMGLPRFLPIVTAFPDYARYVDVARELEAKYAHDPEKAQEVITREMEALGAEMVDGKWHFEGQPVELIFLIRVEDERQEIGDYVANLLEDVGFTVDRQYKTGSEAGPIWMAGDPNEGLWHLYTGGWVTSVILRDEGGVFDFFYTPRGFPFPIWQAQRPSAEFDEVSGRLAWQDFGSMAERDELFTDALRLSLENSQRIWLYDQTSFSPRRSEVEVTSDLAGGVAGAVLWPYTLRREGEVGGTMTIGVPTILTAPWNPIAGGMGLFDGAAMGATGDGAVVADPYTGLALPQRLESADVYVQEGMAVDKTLDWVNLDFASEIQVPDDAWVDWDATEQRFVTAGEAYTQTQTATLKVVCNYPGELFETAWHDGSSFTLGDVVLFMIMVFDPSKPESRIYDEATVPTFQQFISSFKGWRIAQADPLVVEYYANQHVLDAELAPAIVACAYPQYAQSQAAWHMLGLGILAEEAGELAFSADKAAALESEMTSYVSGPSLAILEKHLQQAADAAYIPYEPTLGQYVSTEEAQARWANYSDWYGSKGHFWIGTGPYYLDQVYPVEGNLVLQRFEDYPDPADKWSSYAEARIAEVEVDGPARVVAGSSATYQARVTFAGEPYPLADIAEVKYLVIGATGELVLSGAASVVDDGLFEIVLSEDQTAELEAGSHTLEVIVAPLVVSVPTFESFEFIVLP
ncbi:MAG: ABC transporter substrate-binding protein [Anaerolineae bacterium]